MQSPDFNASTILSAVRRQLEAPALVSPQALPFSAQKTLPCNFTISQFLQLGKEPKLAGYIATVMKAMDAQITFKQFPTLAEKKAKLGDMIECALRNSESLSESLLAKLMRTGEMRAILGVLGVPGVNAKTTAAVMYELLAAAITLPELTQPEEHQEHALTLIQIQQPEEHEPIQIQQTQQTQQTQQPEQTQQIQFANLQDQNAALLLQVQQMQIRMLEQTHLHEKMQLDAQQKVHELELEKTVLEFEQQQQLEPNANKRKRPTTSTKKPGGPSRKSKKKKSEFGRATTPISGWAGSTFYKGEKKYDPPIPQKDVDMSETLEAELIGWRSCAAGKLHRLQRETIGNNMFMDAVNWFDTSGHSTHVRIGGKRHKRRATAAFSISWYEGEMGKDAHGEEEWQEVLHTDDDVQLTADMLFNFNGKGGEPNNAGVHCAYIAAIKNAGVKTTLFDQAGQISYAPTDEELRATVDYNPNYKRILAKRAKADLGSPCLEID